MEECDVNYYMKFVERKYLCQMKVNILDFRDRHNEDLFTSD